VWIPGSGAGLWYTTDGGTSFNKTDEITGSDVVGFGKAKDGADYLAVYAVCTIDGVNGVYRSDDMGENWIRINDFEHQYGSINYSITGDLRVYGRVFVATNGRGVVYGDMVDETEKTIEADGNKHIPSYPSGGRADGIGKGDGTSLGDVNCDGYVDSSDSAALKRGIFNKEEIDNYISEQGQTNADVNKDGNIDIADLKLIKQFVLGEIATL
jgi:hypothetical protein